MSSPSEVTIVAKDGSEDVKFVSKRKALMLRDALAVKGDGCSESSLELTIPEPAKSLQIVLKALEHHQYGFPKDLDTIGCAADLIVASQLAEKLDVEELYKNAVFLYVVKVKCSKADQTRGTIAFEVMKAASHMKDSETAILAIANLDKIKHPACWSKADAKQMRGDDYLDMLEHARRLGWQTRGWSTGQCDWKEMAKRLQAGDTELDAYDSEEDF